MLQCSFGMAPSVLAVVVPEVLTETKPAANITDNVPMVNILPFGMCQSLANPTVAAATAAALGVLTPMPCVPVISRALGAGFAHGLVARHAGAEQHEQVHVRVGRRDPDHQSRHDEGVGRVSGVSSGSDQALELGLAHPETFAYLGGFIGGLYNCAVREEARGDAQGPARRRGWSCFGSPAAKTTSTTTNVRSGPTHGLSCSANLP